MPVSTKVSVIIPVFNAELYLRQCLDSVAGQTLKDIEIICVDDGSTDSSLQILQEYAARDSRFKIVTQKNVNAGAARNNGLQYATGEFLSFLDADDFFEPDMLEKAYLRSVEKDADVTVFRCDHYFEDTQAYEPVEWSIRNNLLPKEKVFAGAEIKENIFLAFVGWPWDKLFSARFVKENSLKFQEQRTTNDLLFVFSSIVKAQRITVMEDVFAHHRKKTGTSLSVTREKSWNCFYKALAALKAQLVAWGLFDRFERDYVNYCLHVSLWNLNTLAAPIQEVLFIMLKNFWFKEFGILNQKADYFYSKGDYAKLQNIMHKDYDKVFSGELPATSAFPVTVKPEHPKVSVVMPSLNVASYIEECILSALNQTMKNIEIICVDAGSTDGTLEILEKYAAMDARVSIIRSEKRSYGHQMNLGLQAAKGEYFAILETDDVIAPDMYDVLANLADALQLDFIKSNFRKFTGDVDNRVFEQFQIAPSSRYFNRVLTPGDDIEIFRGPLYTWSGIYRISFLKEHDIRHNETPGASYQDNGFWFQTFCHAKRMMFTRKSFYMLRRDNPSSSFHSKAKVYCMCEEYDFIRDLLRKNPVLDRKFAPLCARYRHNNYNWTLERVGDEFKLEFLQRYAEDFNKINAAGELLQPYFTPSQWGRLMEIMNDPEAFYESRFGRKEQPAQAGAPTRAVRQAARRVRHDREWVFDMLVKGLECVRDHGVRYTVRRTVRKILKKT